MLGLKTQKKEIDLNLEKEELKESENILERGMYSLKDFLAPISLDRSNEDYLVLGKTYTRSFIMKGFPQQSYIGWLNDLYNYDGDMDVMIHVEPENDRQAIESLTKIITEYETQLLIEKEKGNIKNITKLTDDITALYEERRKLERNTEKLFQIQIGATLFTNSKDNLEKETQKLDNKLRGKKIYLMPMYLRQDETFKSILPYGKSYIKDMYRNFNSGALTSTFPFYNNEIFHKNGVFCGLNHRTGSSIMIDFYDRSVLKNGNITVLGQVGSGKSFFVSLLTMRSALRGIRSVIIDPEGEYMKLTKALGGAYIRISADSKAFINPFDIEESDIVDEDGFPLGGKEVLIKDKVSDVLNLIAIMAGGLTGNQKSIASDMILKLYVDRGITEDPNSLYITEPYFDKVTKQLYHDGMKKPMPTFSDFWKLIDEYGRKNEDVEIITLANTLKIFKKGGIYDLFDTQTSEDLKNFSNKPIVTFDISKLEENILRPIGMYVALSWTWEKFVKKNPHIKKRVVCDEAWMLVSKNMAGSDYTAQFLENASRRIRKRNAGLLVASQNFSEFTNNIHGQAVLKNAETKIFLSQDPSDADDLRDTFRLSDGEINFLLSANRGDILIKLKSESATASVVAFPYEAKLIEKKTKKENRE